MVDRGVYLVNVGSTYEDVAGLVEILHLASDFLKLSRIWLIVSLFARLFSWIAMSGESWLGRNSLECISKRRSNFRFSCQFWE